MLCWPATSGAPAAEAFDTAMIGLAPPGGVCRSGETLPFFGFDPPVANLPEVNTVTPAPGRSPGGARCSYGHL